MMRFADVVVRCLFLSVLALLGCDDGRDEAGGQDASVEATADSSGADQAVDSRSDDAAVAEDAAVVDGPGRWEVVPGPGPRASFHTATVLADGRRVLVVGGRQIDPDHSPYTPKIIGEAWLYSLDDDAFTPAGQLQAARAAHTAALLPDGRVLVVGGVDAEDNSLSSCEIFDPAAFDENDPQKAWSPGPALVGGSRAYHASVTQRDGTVLLLGGRGSADQRSAALFDPRAGEQGEWVVSLALMNTGRASLGAAALETGNVVIAGGWSGRTRQDTLEVFNPQRGSFTLIEQTLSTAKTWTTLSPFRNSEDREQVLIVGGEGEGTALDEVFDPSFDTVTAVNHPGGAPEGHTAVVLDDGRVMVVGGTNNERITEQTVAFDATEVPAGWRPLAPLNIERTEHASVRLADGSVLTVGGRQEAVMVERPERFILGAGVEPPALPKLSWDTLESGITEQLEAVWGAGTDHLIAVGHVSTLLEYRGATGKWTPMTPPAGFSGPLYDVHGSAANNVFAVGQRTSVWRYNGAEWVAKSGDAVDSADLRGVWVEGATVYAVGRRGTIVRTTNGGDEWETMVSPLPYADLHAVRRCGGDGLYAVGSDATLLRLDGAEWKIVQPVPTGYSDLVDVWCGDALPLFAVGDSGLSYRFGSDGWNVMGSRQSRLISAIAGDAAGTLFAGGVDGYLRYAKTSQFSWFDLAASALPDGTELFGIWTGGGQVFAVGADGTILRGRPDTAE